jgi:hypothetical protein
LPKSSTWAGQNQNKRKRITKAQKNEDTKFWSFFFFVLSAHRDEAGASFTACKEQLPKRGISVSDSECSPAVWRHREGGNKRKSLQQGGQCSFGRGAFRGIFPLMRKEMMLLFYGVAWYMGTHRKNRQDAAGEQHNNARQG